MTNTRPHELDAEVFEVRSLVHRDAGTFLKATSLPWLVAAAALPGRALHLALVVKLQTDLEKRETIRLQRRLSQHFGLDRYAERRALSALERRGLVKIARRRGARPVVTILGADP